MQAVSVYFVFNCFLSKKLVKLQLHVLISTLQQAINCDTKIATLRYCNEVFVLYYLPSLMVILTYCSRH